MSGRIAGWVLLALAGLAVAVALSVAASNLSTQPIGLSAEPLRAGDRLAPVVRTPAKPVARPKPKPKQTAKPKPKATPNTTPTVTQIVPVPQTPTTTTRGSGETSDDPGGEHSRGDD